MKSFKRTRGFTLIELLVVISIIGLLSSIVLVALNGARQKGVLASGQEFEHSAYSGLYGNIAMEFDFTTGCGVSGSGIPSLTDTINKVTLPYLNSQPTCNSDSPISTRMSAQFINSQRFYNGGSNIMINNVDPTRLSTSLWMKTSLSSVNGGEVGAVVALSQFNISLLNGNLYTGITGSLTCYAPYPSDGNWHQIFVSVDANSGDANPGIAMYIDGKRVSLSGSCSVPNTWTNGLNNTAMYFPDNTSATPLLLNHLVFYAAAP